MTIPRNLGTFAEYAGAANRPTVNLPNAGEVTTVSATAATGTINYDAITQSVWASIPAVADPAQSNPYLSNQAAFLDYRSQVREIAVNPPSTPVTDWPVLPQEVWTNAP